MGAAGAVMMGGGSMIGAYSSFEAGRQQERVDLFNAKLADIKASEAIKLGEDQVGIVRTDARRISGAQRASLAAQGVTLDTGTAADLIDDTDRQAAIDVRNTRLNAAKEAWGFKVEAFSSRANAKYARRAGTLNAAGQLMGGGGQTANMASDARYRKGV